jgi:uncharacterized protein YeaO (DUF488 family)
MIKIKRVYEDPSDADHVRYLVDRLWPRGLSKEAAKLDGWLKELAPSDDLRKWYGHEKDRWGEFKRRYKLELQAKTKQKLLDDLAEKARHGPITLLFGAKDTERNNAVVLGEVLKAKLASQRKE